METSNDLGPLIAAYPARPRSKAIPIILMLTGCLLFLSSLGYGLYRSYYGYTKYGIAAALSWSWPWFLAAAVILFFTLLLLPQLFSRPGLISVHKNGLMIISGGRPASQTPVPWEKLAGIAVDAESKGRSAEGTKVEINHQAALIFKRGRPLLLKEKGSGRWVIDRLPELISHIKAVLYPRLLPAMEVDFNSGAWLQFGPVSIHSLAFSLETGNVSTHQIPWRQVKRITVENGELVVELDGRGKQPVRKAVPVAQIPNLELMLQIIDSCAKG